MPVVLLHTRVIFGAQQLAEVLFFGRSRGHLAAAATEDEPTKTESEPEREGEWKRVCVCVCVLVPANELGLQWLLLLPTEKARASSIKAMQFLLMIITSHLATTTLT